MALSFSIVIPTLNRRNMLGRALASIREQCWTEVEIIVVDGGSTDGTVEDLRQDRDVQLIHGPDRGLYDAINKGIARCTGEVIGLLNSDDDYPRETFAAAAAAFTADADAVCGTALVMDDDRVVSAFDDEAAKSLASPRIALIGSCMLNARFMRREAMLRIGTFSLDYEFVSDRDWLTRWYEAGLSTVTIDHVVYRYRQHSGSLTFDAERRRELPIRRDLLRLARHWRRTGEASTETRRTAMLLEGRCVAKLAVRAVRNGHLAECHRLLFERDGRASLDPLITAARGGIDWAARSLQAAHRMRR